MKNSEYWRQRFTAVALSTQRQSLDFLGILDDEYKTATASIKKELESWYQRFAVNNKISMAEAKRLLTTKELAEFRWTVNDYMKHGQNPAQWAKQLENASARVHVSRLEALQIQLQHQAEVLFGNQLDGIDKLARKIYTEGYYHTAFELQKGTEIGHGIGSINEKQLNNVLSTPWTSDDKTFRDRCWTNKQQLVTSVRTQLAQATMRGDSPDKAINAITKEFNVSKNKASRLVMTESAYFAAEAQQTCFDDLDVEKFEIVATLDLTTSELCQSLDGKVFPMSDYEVGVTAPPFHPWCRTTTCPWFADEVGERAARGADGKTYYVPSNMTYPEWKKYNEAVSNEPQITKDLESVVASIDGANLEGLKNKLKTPKSFIRKVEMDKAHGMTKELAIERINDTVRYTQISSVENLTENYFKTVDELKKRGYTLVKTKNTWGDVYNPYKGVNSVFCSPKGQNFELQFHTQESFALKKGQMHQLYEKQRLIKDVDSAEHKSITDEMFGLSRNLKIPTNIKDVTS